MRIKYNKQIHIFFLNYHNGCLPLPAKITDRLIWRKCYLHSLHLLLMSNLVLVKVSNLDQDFIEMMISELTNRNQIENRRTPQGLDSFRGPCLSHQNKRKSFVVFYMKNATTFPPSSWK